MGLSDDGHGPEPEGSPRCPSEHPRVAFLTGMHRLCETLVSTGYLDGDEIAWPPQTLRLNARDWLDHGLSQEAVEVLNFLPLFDFARLTSDQLAILPGAAPHDFLAQASSTYATDPRCQGGDPGSNTPPSWLPLAYRVGYGAIAWYYNVTDQSIGIWSDLEDPSTGPIDTVPITWNPARQVLDGWLGHLRDLSWIPDRTADQAPIYVLADMQALPPGSHSAAIHPFDRQQNQLKAFYARRRIYREHGWPSEQYRRDECRASLTDFNAQLDTLRRNLQAALHPSMEPYMYYPEVQAEPARHYAAFLEAAAGDDAQ